MKRYKYSALILASALFMSGITTSCDETDDAISDLQGLFEAPTNLDITGATLADKTKNDQLRTFSVDFATAQGQNAHLVLVANKYFIASNGYTYAPASTAKNGNFTDGSTINGKAIVDGTFALAADGDNITISRCSLFASDGSAFRLQGAAVLAFEPDDPTVLTIKPVYNMDGSQSLYQLNADGTATITFTTGGYTEEFDMTTYQNVYKGEGNDLQVVFKLNNGKLTPGTYAPNTGYVAGYTFLNDAYTAWGIPAFEDYAGTLWYTIENGAKTPSLVTSGDFIVTKNGPMYSILIDQGKGGIYAEFKGSIGDIDPDGSSAGTLVQMTSCVGVANYAQLGWTGLIDIQLANGDVTASTDPATYQTTYEGNGDFIQIEVYSQQGVGTLARGTYEIADDSSFGEMKFKAGGVGMYGDGGTFVKPVVNGQLGEAQFITEGTLTIEGEGDDTKITLNAGDVTYMFTGNIGL